MSEDAYGARDVAVRFCPDAITLEYKSTKLLNLSDSKRRMDEGCDLIADPMHPLHNDSICDSVGCRLV